MQSGPYRQDQPSRDGGDDRPTDAQLEGATADGSPTPNPGIEDATNGGDLLEIELNAERLNLAEHPQDKVAILRETAATKVTCVTTTI